MMYLVVVTCQSKITGQPVTIPQNITTPKQAVQKWCQTKQQKLDEN